MNLTARSGRSMPDIVSEAFAICVRNWRSVYAATAVAAVFAGLVSFGLTAAVNGAGAGSGDTSKLSVAAQTAVLGASIASGLASLALYVAAQILVYPVVTAVTLKRRPSARPLPGSTAAIGSGVIAAAAIVIAAVALSATIIGIPIAILLVVRWSFAGQELARGARGPVAALRASWHTVQGNWWRVAFVSIAIGVLGVLPRLVLLPISSTFPNSAVELLVDVVGALLSVPFVTVATVVLYIDVLTRKGEPLRPSTPTVPLDEGR
jgi:hypothetical protein